MKKLITWLLNFWKKPKIGEYIPKTDEEYIKLFAEKTPEGGGKPKEHIFDLQKAICNYMDGLKPEHRSEVQTLIGETCTIIHAETKAIPVRIIFANKDEINIKLSKAHIKNSKKI